MPAIDGDRSRNRSSSTTAPRRPVPIEWSQQSAAGFEAAGKDVELMTYDGEGHEFGPRWPGSMATILAFFAEHLR